MFVDDLHYIPVAIVLQNSAFFKTERFFFILIDTTVHWGYFECLTNELPEETTRKMSWMTGYETENILGL